MTLSILHRMTGVALSIGLIALVFWLESIAFGEASYQMFASWISTPLGQLMLLGWSFSLFFHLSNGIRHLFWDFGLGFETKQTVRSAWLVLIATVFLTGSYWIIMRGGLL